MTVATLFAAQFIRAWIYKYLQLPLL
jgi:hypothetical protein